MFARILVFIGLLIALASAIAVISIYAKHFRALYEAISNRRKYNGPGIIELLVAVIMLTAVIVVSPIIYFNVQADEIMLNKAELRLDGVVPFKEPNTDPLLFNVQWTNHGSLTLVNGSLALRGLLLNGIIPLPKDKADAMLVEVENELKTIWKERKTNVADVLSGQAILITIPDFALSAADWNAVLQGQASLYVFYAMSYQDDAVKNKGYWHGDFCTYFTYKQTFYHNCGLNHIELSTH